MGKRERRAKIVKVITAAALLVLVVSLEPSSQTMDCDFDSTRASIKHARGYYSDFDYACALEEIRVVLANSSLDSQSRCEAHLLKAATMYDSLYFADTEETRNTVLSIGKDAFRVYPDWNGPYATDDRGFRMLMSDAKKAAAEPDKSRQVRLTIVAYPVESQIAIDNDMWMPQVPKGISPGSHEIVIKHPLFGFITDTVDVSSDTTVEYDLLGLLKARALGMIQDSITSSDNLRADSIAKLDKQLRLQVFGSTAKARIAVDLDGQVKAKVYPPIPQFVVKPEPMFVEFTVSFTKYGTGHAVKIDSVVFFEKIAEYKLVVEGSSDAIHFGRAEWRSLPTIEALIYLDEPGL